MSSNPANDRRTQIAALFAQMDTRRQDLMLGLAVQLLDLGYSAECDGGPLHLIEGGRILAPARNLSPDWLACYVAFFDVMNQREEAQRMVRDWEASRPSEVAA